MIVRGLQDTVAKRRLHEGSDYEKLLAEEMAKITPEAAAERVVPVYARYISREHATAVADFFESPPGRKFMAKILASPMNNDIRFLPSDIAAISAFENTPAAKAWIESNEQAKPDLRLSMESWGREIMSARLTSDPAAVSTVLGSDPVLKQVLLAVRTFLIRAQQEEQKFNRLIDEFENMAILAPENLVAAEKIRQGKRSIDNVETTIEDYLATLAKMQQELRAEVRKTETFDSSQKEFLERFEKGLTTGLELRLRFAENQRTLINLFRRILDLAEGGLGTIRFENNRLVFDRDTDIENYRSLMAQIRQAGAEENKILAESRSAREKVEFLTKDFFVKNSPGASPAPAPQAQTSPPPSVSATGTDVVSRSPPQPPRRQRFVTARTAEPVFADYVNKLLSQLKKYVATQRGETAPGAQERETVLTISILASGKLQNVSVNQSSGDKALDEALVNLVRRFSTFEPFSEDMKKEIDILSVISTL